jgi:trimeric autotransporter adhesin
MAITGHVGSTAVPEAHSQLASSLRARALSKQRHTQHTNDLADALASQAHAIDDALVKLASQSGTRESSTASVAASFTPVRALVPGTSAPWNAEKPPSRHSSQRHYSHRSTPAVSPLSRVSRPSASSNGPHGMYRCDRSRTPLHDSFSALPRSALVAGTCAAAAVAHKQSAADVAAQTVLTHLHAAHVQASVAEGAQKHLALAKSILAEVRRCSEGAVAPVHAAEVKVSAWQSEVDGAVEKLRRVHSCASAAKDQAFQACKAAENAAQRASAAVSGATLMAGAHAASLASDRADSMCTGDAQAPFSLPSDAAQALTQAQASLTELQAAWVHERERAETAKATAQYRKAAASQQGSQLRQEAQLAAQQAQQLSKDGHASEAAAAVAAARSLRHRSNSATAESMNAETAIASAIAASAQADTQVHTTGEHLAVVGSHLQTRVKTSVVWEGLEAADEEPREAEGQLVALEASAHLASMHATVTLSQASRLSDEASRLQAQLKDAERSGDTFASDTLRPTLVAIESEASAAESATADLAATAAQARAQASVAAAAIATSRERASTSRASAMQVAASAASTAEAGWRRLAEAVGGSVHLASAQLGELEATVETLRREAETRDREADTLERQGQFGEARAASGEAQRLCRDAESVCIFPFPGPSHALLGRSIAHLHLRAPCKIRVT